jgi:chromosome partitioning protein
MSSAQTHIIVFANEKGGTGKSTTAVHTGVALAAMGHRVGMLDLDPRQRTITRYLENRAETVRRRGVSLPTPDFAVFTGSEERDLEAQYRSMVEGRDFLIVDTPGRDDIFAKYMAARANTLVTPMNDSFVDFDLIGQVDAETFKVKRLSFYSELIFEARKSRAKTDGVTIDWVVLRNRLQHLEARNMRRVGDALIELSKRVGFRVIPGLSERVIFRELFPSGLTLLDKGHLGDLGFSHLTARQELREMIAGLALPVADSAQAEMEQSAA